MAYRVHIARSGKLENYNLICNGYSSQQGFYVFHDVEEVRKNNVFTHEKLYVNKKHIEDFSVDTEQDEA